jgi:hypothetical protein
VVCPLALTQTPPESFEYFSVVGNVLDLEPIVTVDVGVALLSLSTPVAMSIRRNLPVLALILCLALALVAEAARAYAANTADQTGEQFFVETKTGHVGIGTSQPASAIDVGAGEVKIGSSGAVCTPTIEGAVRYADKKLQFCDGEGWRGVSTASTPR